MGKKSTKELLKAAKLPERSVSICLRGDLVADIEELDRRLKQAIEDRKTNGRLGTKTDAEGLAEQVEAKRAEMREYTVSFRLRALKSAAWRELTAKYRKGEGGIDLMALMGEALPASVIEPDDLDAEDWETLNENTAPAELGKLIDAVWELNMQGVDVPKSRYASALIRKSDGD